MTRSLLTTTRTGKPGRMVSVGWMFSCRLTICWPTFDAVPCALSRIEAAQAELKRVEREHEKILDLCLKDAMPVDMLKERSGKLEARKKELAGVLDEADEPPPLLHPNLAE